MIQGGDPNSQGQRSLERRHRRAGLHGAGRDQAPARARRRRHGAAGRPGQSARASSGSQFFIDVAGLPSLDARRLHGVRLRDLGHGRGRQDRGVLERRDAARGAAAGESRQEGADHPRHLEPLSKWEKPAAAEGKAAEAKTEGK